jgi:hypothetical protein
MITLLESIQEPLQQTIQHLQQRGARLERDQVALREDTGAEIFERDQNLYAARRVNRIAQAQLAEANTLIGQKNEYIGQLEGRLHRELTEKDGLIAQINGLNDRAEVDQHAIGDLQIRLNATNQRVLNIEQQILHERVRHRREYRLGHLEGEQRRFQERLTIIQSLSYNGGFLAGAVLGGIFLGPLGVLLGSYVGIGAGGLSVMCSAKPLEQQLSRVTEELKQVRETLGEEITSPLEIT